MSVPPPIPNPIERPLAPTYIIGHKNPDADAICSAMAYAAFKEASGQPGYVAARCGNSNARIDAILNRFGATLPEFVGDVTPRVEDIMQHNPYVVSIDDTCARALELLDLHDVRALPVLDREGRLDGEADRDDFGRRGERGEFGGHRFVIDGVMRMAACGGERPAGVCPREIDRCTRAFDGCAGDHELRDAEFARPGDHGVAIVVVRVVAEIDPDVDQRSEASA